MKRMMIAAAFALVAALAVCAEEDYSAFKGLSKEQRKALSPEQRVKYKRYLMMRRYGGYIDQRQPDSGKFVFVNAQGTVPNAAWTNQYEIISDAFSVELAEARHDGEVTPANAAETVKKSGGNAGVVVVDQQGLPSLLIAPEAGWGIVNVGALKADNPAADKLAHRVRREIWRGFAMVAGSPNTEWPQCLLGSICSLSDLDNIQSEAVSPEPASKIQKHLLRLGIKPFKRVTYKQACREGWAPPPANEFQKAIWDEIHKLPEKPMKIEFDPAKGK